MAAKPPDEVTGEIAEVAGRLRAAGLDDAADAAERAARVAASDPLLAQDILRQASDDLMARVPGYGHRRKTP